MIISKHYLKHCLWQDYMNRLMFKYSAVKVQNIYNRLKSAVRVKDRSQFYHYLNNITRQIKQEAFASQNFGDWRFAQDFIQLNPPATMQQIKSGLFWAKFYLTDLRIGDSLKKIDFEKQTIQNIIIFYNTLGFIKLEQEFNTIQQVLLKKLDDKTLVLKEDQINNIFEVRYHRIKRTKLKFLNHKVAIKLVPHLLKVLNDLEVTRQSYILLYLASQELEIHTGNQLLNDIFNLLMEKILARSLPHSTRIIANYTGALTFINRITKAKELLSRIENYLGQMKELPKDFSAILIHHNSRKLQNTGSHLLSTNLLKRLLSVFASSTMEFKQSQRLIKSLASQDLELIPKVQLYKNIEDMTKNDKLSLCGLQLLLRCQIDIQPLVDMVLKKKMINGEHQQVRWGILLANFNLAKYNNIVQITQNKLISYLKTVPFVILNAFEECLLTDTAYFERICIIITKQLSTMQIHKQLNEFQLYRLLYLLSGNQQSHKHILEYLKQLKVRENEKGIKKILSALFKQGTRFHTNARINFSCLLVKQFGISSSQYIDYINQNRQLLLIFEKPQNINKLLQMLSPKNTIHSMLKIAYHMKFTKKGSAESVLALCAQHQYFQQYSKWYNVVKSI